MKLIPICLQGNSDAVMEGTQLLCSKLSAVVSEYGTVIEPQHRESPGLSLSWQKDRCIIGYSILPEFFRWLAICVHQLRTDTRKDLVEHRWFDTCGAMLDLSRNMVITVETAKDYIEYMALMGMNMLMLYTEDTYPIEKYPYFGYMRGAYSAEELRQIDTYALIFGIELIPCIQTLSHLTTALRWSYARKFADTGSTLYVGKEDTYQFIEDMFRTVKQCFTTRRIHIGMDEASDIGRGRRFRAEGYTPGLKLMTQHLQKVCELAKKHGLEPMMWSDMFYKFGTQGGDYDLTSEMPENLSEQIPENIEMVYWDYCIEDTALTDKFIKRHAQDLQRKTIFAGGIWTWGRLLTNYGKTFSTARCQLKACKENGIREVFATSWNNSGALCNLYTILPGLQMWAEQCYHEDVSDAQLSHMFTVCTGYALKDFLLLDVDDFSVEEKSKYMLEGCICINSSAQHFFNDILTGLFDKTLSGYDFHHHYSQRLAQLQALTDMGKFQDLFAQTTLLTKILLLKSELGLGITEAYRSGDMRALALCKDKAKTLLQILEQYHGLSMQIWHKQNKPFGWDGADMLFGSLEARVKTAIHRVSDYLDGSATSLPELEAERLYYNGIEKPLMESGAYRAIMTPGV